MQEALDVVRSMFAALDDEDWTGAARLFSHDQVEVWYEELIRHRPREEDSAWTVERLRLHEPDMPLEVAEYRIAEMRKHHFARPPSDELADVKSWAEAAELGAVEAYGRFLKAHDPRIQLRRAIAELPPELRSAAELQSPGFSHVVIGGVPEGDRRVHVVYRRNWSGEELGSLHLLTCSRSEEGWRIEVSSEWMMAMYNSMVVAEAHEEDSPEGRTDGV